MSTADDPIRVLHVDDEPAFADVVSTFLVREDDRIAVETATSAAAGLGRIADSDVDCVVSDYDMPEQNGVEFLRAVRRDHGDLPFILFTGKGSEAVASEAISAGVSEYLQKETGTSQYAVLAHRIGNVVERRRSRLAVESTERKLSQIAENTDDILYMVDGDWTELLFVNSSYEDIWGASPDALRADPASFLEHVHPEDRALATASMNRLRDGEADAVEYRVLFDDDDVRWVRGESKPILDDDGTVSRIVGFVRDVTERKRRERDLRARAVAMDAASDGIAILDEDEEYVFMNESHARIYGFDDPEQLVGETWRVCYDDDAVRQFEDEILPVLFDDGHWQGEMTVTVADGRTIEQELTLSRLDESLVICVVRTSGD